MDHVRLHGITLDHKHWFTIFLTCVDFTMLYINLKRGCIAFSGYTNHWPESKKLPFIGNVKITERF